MGSIHNCVDVHYHTKAWGSDIDVQNAHRIDPGKLIADNCMNIWRYISTGLKLIFRRPLVGTSLISILPDKRILLARRRDTKQWSLPGGIVDWGEDLTQCARRELLEETGFTLVRISRLVGVYSSLKRDPRFHAIVVAIAVEVAPIAETIKDTDEILEVKAFESLQIPFDDLSHDHARQLQDYFDGRTVVA